MKLTPLVEKAIQRSAELHRYQTRRHGDIPYAAHPFAVAFLLQAYTDDEHVLAAALLHDVLEDVRGYGFEDLQKEFGAAVAGIVVEVSEDRSPYASEKKDVKTWRFRKERYLATLHDMSPEALLVAAGDKYHNLSSLIEGYEMHGEHFWENFHAPKPKQESILWFYESASTIIASRLDNDLAKRLQEVYKQFSRKVSK